MELREAYAELEIDVGASADSVRQARTILLKVWHPDRHQQDDKVKLAAERKTIRINEAYRLIEQSGFPSVDHQANEKRDAAADREYELRLRELDLMEREIALKEREAARPTAHEWIDKKVTAVGKGTANALIAIGIAILIVAAIVIVAEALSPGSTR